MNNDMLPTANTDMNKKLTFNKETIRRLGNHDSDGPQRPQLSATNCTPCFSRGRTCDDSCA